MRPPRPGCGTVSSAQLLTLPATISTSEPGVGTTQLSFLPPASRSATDVWGSSERRLATAQPPEPPPTTTKSNVSATACPPKSCFRSGASARALGPELLRRRVCRFRCPTLVSHGLSGKSGSNRQVRRDNGRFDRHKIPKRWPAALSKAALRWYIRLAPRGFARVAFSGSL